MTGFRYLSTQTVFVPAAVVEAVLCVFNAVYFSLRASYSYSQSLHLLLSFHVFNHYAHVRCTLVNHAFYMFYI